MFNKTPKNNEKKEVGFLQTNTELQTALLCGKIKQTRGFFLFYKTAFLSRGNQVKLVNLMKINNCYELEDTSPTI